MQFSNLLKLLSLVFVSFNDPLYADDSGWSFEDTELYEDEFDDMYDPFESFNRVMFKINDALDKAFFVPAATFYKHVVPNFLQIGVENFIHNFWAPVRFVNFILQKDSEHVVKTVWRFIINTLFGFFGTIDMAAKMGLDKKDTDFGKTLKKWGATTGPYVVLPLFGPTSLRGATGKAIHLPVDPIAKVSLSNYKKNTRNRLYYTIYGTDLLAKRSKLLGIMKELEQMSSDKYITTRRAIAAAEK